MYPENCWRTGSPRFPRASESQCRAKRGLCSRHAAASIAAPAFLRQSGSGSGRGARDAGKATCLRRPAGAKLAAATRQSEERSWLPSLLASGSTGLTSLGWTSDSSTVGVVAEPPYVARQPLRNPSVLRLTCHTITTSSRSCAPPQLHVRVRRRLVHHDASGVVSVFAGGAK